MYHNAGTTYTYTALEPRKVMRHTQFWWNLIHKVALMHCQNNSKYNRQKAQFYKLYNIWTVDHKLQNVEFNWDRKIMFCSNVMFGTYKQDMKIDYLLFYVLLKNFSLISRRQRYRWRAREFRSMLSAQSLWTGRDLYRAPPATTLGLGFPI
jgi:hypothetical protein